MEKKEAKIKCNGCGTSFKVKVPVTDRPVSFKCKNCGKVLKIRIKGDAPAEPRASQPGAAPSGPSAGSQPELPGFESTQEDDGAGNDLPDFGDEAAMAPPGGREAGTIQVPPSVSPSQFEPTERIGPVGFETTAQTDEEAARATAAAHPMRTPSMEEEPGLRQEQRGAVSEDQVKRWFVLSGDILKGPFADGQVHDMIKKGEIEADTSLRMGERPWIKAADIAVFRKHFAKELPPPDHEALPSISLLEQTEGEVEMTPFYTEIPKLVPYPLGNGNFVPLAIFAGIAFVLFTVLCLDFTIGLPVNIIGWIILYGYLGTLMQQSAAAPSGRPPDWDFGNAAGLGANGAKIFAVLLAFSLLPVTVCMVLMIFFFLHGMAGLGYVFLLLTIMVFLGSMFVVPAALVTLGGTRNIAQALNPGKLIALIRKGGHAYTMLGALSVVAGLACMVVTILSIFLTDIPIAGFVVSGILMAAVFSYGHFIWFHMLGRFSVENPELAGQMAYPASA